MKKKTPPPAQVTIANNNFCAVKWDATAVESVKTVAEALLTNARALESLAQLFKSQNVHVETMLAIKP